LSMAGRTTLAQSRVTALPTYTMQTAALPYTVCEEIEKQTRAFLFGSGVKKPHLVRWDRA